MLVFHQVLITFLAHFYYFFFSCCLLGRYIIYIRFCACFNKKNRLCGFLLEQAGIPPAAQPPFRPCSDSNDPPGHSLTSFEVRSSRSILRLFQQKRTACAVLLLEQAGIEPASESSSITVSPITVSVLTFPLPHVHSQTYDFSSL